MRKTIFSRRIVLVLAVFLLFVTTNVASSSAPDTKPVTSNVGSLKGDFQVTPTGQAHYSIPIEVSPGTAGITPALSIVYDSSSSNIRNGLLGMGFSLEGLTAITRCPSNKTQNGLIHGVDFTDQDRFCFNGEQLVAVKGGYGANGTEYRTYIDSKTKIISYGRQGNSPASFKVWTKGGQIAKYAFTSDSQIKAEGKDSVAVWSLNKIQDTVGNYLEVHYFKDEAKGIFYPIEINYTGNEKARVLPYNSVKFIYEDRPDTRTTYQAGSKNSLDKRLKTIQTFQGSNLVYEYKFDYEISKNTFRSRIASIQKCTGSGVCLPPTKFDWQVNEEGWDETPGFKLPEALFVDRRPNGKLIDINGDGLPDYIKADTNHIGSWLNNGFGWVQDDSYKLPFVLYYDNIVVATLADLNGDGLPDYVLAHQDGEEKYIRSSLNNGKGWFQNNQNDENEWFQNYRYYLPDVLFSAENEVTATLIDLNGDGLPDYVKANTHHIESRLWQYNSWFDWGWVQDDNYKLPNVLYGANNSALATLADLNGDGLPDYALSYQDKEKKYINSWLNSGKGWSQNNNYNLPDVICGAENEVTATLIDLNGDGLPDYVKANSHHIDSWLNNGFGWVQDNNYKLPNVLYGANNSVLATLADLNGDGLPDYALSYQGREKKYINSWLNNGKGWSQNNNYDLPDVICGVENDVTAIVIDLNGDGLPDYVTAYRVDGKDHIDTYLNRAKKLPDYLISVTDGLGAKFSIEYEPLSGVNEKVYTKDHDAKYPNFDWQGPMYVVYKTSSNSAANDPKVIDKMKAKSGIIQRAYTEDALNHITTYHYTGAKFNHLGLGFLGFHKVTTKDESTGINTTTTYSQDINSHNIGLPVASETRLASGALISSSEDTWELKTLRDSNVNTIYYSPYVKTSVKKTFDLKGNHLSTTTVNNTIDDYGNPTEISSTVHEIQTNRDYTTITQNTYNNNPNKWFLGELVKATVTKKAPKYFNQKRTSSFSYDPDTSLLMETIAEPDDLKLALTTKYERDAFGNIIMTTVSGKGIEDRVSKVKYDEYGRFIIQSTNPLNQTVSQKTDPKFGVVIKASDLNGLETFYQYDDFGRQVLQVTPDGTKTKISYEETYGGFVSCGTVFLNDGRVTYIKSLFEEYQKKFREPFRSVSYVITSHTDNSTTNKEYYDILNRKVATTTQNMDGSAIWQLIYYDELGRVSKKTHPFFEGYPIYYISIQYDDLGRMVKSILPDGNLTETIYDGFTTTIINQAQQRRIKEINAVGELVKTTDNLGSVTTYEYDPYGNMTVVTDSAGNKSSIQYDRLGRKTAIDDPDKGQWKYEYDVLGNLTSQTDAKGQTTTFKYDKLNRMVNRTDSAGTSTWEYDTAPNGIGKLAKTNSLNLVGKRAQEKIEAPAKALHDGLEVYTRTYSYDDLSRVTQVNTNIKNKTYTSSYSYDKNSRLDIETYPNGLKVKNSYNALGYLVEISDVATEKVYWELNAKDAEGHIISESRSNGLITNYTYEPKTGFLKEINTILDINLAAQQKLMPSLTGVTATSQKFSEANPADIKANLEVQKDIYQYDETIGNITAHRDAVNNVEESFHYDELNRLTLIQSGERESQRLRYDALGNITYKSDVGTYKYGKNGAGPHAVTSIKGKQAGRFEYDANGDQTRGTLNGIERTISYTSYSKPLTIKTPKAEVSFFYNADREKFARVDYLNETASDCKDGWWNKCTKHKTTVTYYLGNYEIVTIENEGGSTITQQKAYIGPNTVYIKTEDNKDSKNNHTKIYEMLHNNIGSVTDITDESGNVLQHFSYTPFGEQKQTKGAILSDPLTNRGFTGHEEVNVGGINLIHMDGRIYDPVIGRFLSADPYIQDPTNSQSLNRYSYCINNPLVLTDPSGFGFWGSLFRSIRDFFSNPIVRIITGAIVGIALGPIGFNLMGTWWAAAVGAATTVALGVATGASFKQILFEGAVTFVIVGGFSYAYESQQAAQQAYGISGSGLSGGAAGVDELIKGKSENKPKEPGEDFPNKDYRNSTRNASSDNTADQQHRSAAYKSGRNFSNVGSTGSSKYNAGNGWNGAGSDAYSWCYEKAGWQKTAGYSGATISSDLMLCENAQRMSLIVALGVGGGGGRSGAANALGERTAGRSIGKVIQWAEDYLGKDAKVITNEAGDKIFRNADNTRRVRFDIKTTHGDDPHMHIETKQGTRWKDSSDQHRIYFNGE